MNSERTEDLSETALESLNRRLVQVEYEVALIKFKEHYATKELLIECQNSIIRWTVGAAIVSALLKEVLISCA